MLECWSEIPGYKQFVSDQWRSFQVDGLSGCIVKKKFKLIKPSLKLWNSNYVQNLLRRISTIKERIALLDCKGEIVSLSDGKFEELHGLTGDLHFLSRITTSICCQQSRLLLLKERFEL